MKILIIDDTKTTLAILKAQLNEMNHEVIVANSGEEGILLFQKTHPDLIIMDVVMEGVGGYECAKIIREMSHDDWVPIIFLSAAIDDASIAKGIDAGGDDYLTKPFSEITLGAKIKAMQRIADMRRKLYELTQKLQILSTTDNLTRVNNRFQFELTIHERILEANQQQKSFALLFLDLDKFKIVNDTLGHHVGDLLLIEVVQRIQSCTDPNDFIARLGGDEFSVILAPANDPYFAGIVAKNIIQALSRHFKIEKYSISIGVSIGIAIYPQMGVDAEELIKNADAAMYRVKETGRNHYQYFIAPEIIYP